LIVICSKFDDYSIVSEVKHTITSVVLLQMSGALIEG
jgi:hypothetical protein